MISIQSRGFSMTDALKDYVRKRLDFILAHNANKVRRANVRLSDINGPRGGVDKRCMISIKINGQPAIVINDVQHDMYFAIDRAADRADRVIRRRLSMDRIHSRRRRRVSGRQQDIYFNNESVAF